MYVNHTPFLELFLDNYLDSEFNYNTGLPKECFRELYLRYCGAPPLNKPYKLFLLFQYYRLYPSSRHFSSVFGINYSSFSRLIQRLRRWEAALAAVIDELNEAWLNRNLIQHITTRFRCECERFN